MNFKCRVTRISFCTLIITLKNIFLVALLHSNIKFYQQIIDKNLFFNKRSKTDIYLSVFFFQKKAKLLLHLTIIFIKVLIL